MSWETFRTNVTAKMKSANWGSTSEFANFLANEYQACVKNGADNVTKNSLRKGNFPMMVSLLNVAGTTGMATKTEDFWSKWMDLLGQAIVGYWTGAQLTVTKIPKTPAPGTTANMQVTSVNVTNPGVWPKGFFVAPNDDVSVFVNSFISAAKLHLTTISGQCTTISQYPPPAPPGPAVLPWAGYSVKTGNEKDEAVVIDTAEIDRKEKQAIKKDHKKAEAIVAKFAAFLKQKKAAKEIPQSTTGYENNVSNSQAKGTLGKPSGGDNGLFIKCGGKYWPAAGSPGNFSVDHTEKPSGSAKCMQHPRTWYKENQQYISAHLVYFNVPLKKGVSKRLIHKNFAAILTPAFEEIKSKGLHMYIDNCAGGYAVRNVTCGSRFSNHAWGTAIDLNTEHYEYGKSFAVKTTFDAKYAEIAAILVKHGCTWLQRNDPMHFSIYE